MEKEPKPPKSAPFFVQIIIFIGAFIACLIWSSNHFLSLIFFSPFAMTWFVLWRRYNISFDAYRIEHVIWQIENLDSFIVNNKNYLAEGQPLIDDDDPIEWEFDLKFRIRTAELKREELQSKLEGLLDGKSSWSLL